MSKTEMIITKYDLLYEQRLSTVESEMKASNEKFNQSYQEIRKDIREIRADTRSDFRWLIGIMIGGFSGTFGLIASLFVLMAHGFKWF